MTVAYQPYLYLHLIDSEMNEIITIASEICRCHPLIGHQIQKNASINLIIKVLKMWFLMSICMGLCQV